LRAQAPRRPVVLPVDRPIIDPVIDEPMRSMPDLARLRRGAPLPRLRPAQQAVSRLTHLAACSARVADRDPRRDRSVGGASRSSDAPTRSGGDARPQGRPDTQRARTLRPGMAAAARAAAH
jgi:hypothetical protein